MTSTRCEGDVDTQMQDDDHRSTDVSDLDFVSTFMSAEASRETSELNYDPECVPVSPVSSDHESHNDDEVEVGEVTEWQESDVNSEKRCVDDVDGGNDNNGPKLSLPHRPWRDRRIHRNRSRSFVPGTGRSDYKRKFRRDRTPDGNQGRCSYWSNLGKNRRNNSPVRHHRNDRDGGHNSHHHRLNPRNRTNNRHGSGHRFERGGAHHFRDRSPERGASSSNRRDKRDVVKNSDDLIYRANKVMFAFASSAECNNNIDEILEKAIQSRPGENPFGSDRTGRMLLAAYTLGSNTLRRRVIANRHNRF